MSAPVLQRGDRVHLCIWAVNQRSADEQHARLTKAYGLQGVTLIETAIVFSPDGHKVKPPRVLAVFR